jgi:hypothetical protein
VLYSTLFEAIPLFAAATGSGVDCVDDRKPKKAMIDNAANAMPETKAVKTCLVTLSRGHTQRSVLWACEGAWMS